jgi:hypothetical protein
MRSSYPADTDTSDGQPEPLQSNIRICRGGHQIQKGFRSRIAFRVAATCRAFTHDRENPKADSQKPVPGLASCLAVRQGNVERRTLTGTQLLNLHMNDTGVHVNRLLTTRGSPGSAPALSHPVFRRRRDSIDFGALVSRKFFYFGEGNPALSTLRLHEFYTESGRCGNGQGSQKALH